MFNKTFIVFASALTLNLLWENAHSVLYVSYQNGAITNLILLRAALYDAVVTTLFLFLFLWFPTLKRSRWIAYAGLTIFAVALEMWAQGTGRWIYADTMPIIPFLNAGLTPVIQLGLIGFVALRVTNRFIPEADIA